MKAAEILINAIKTRQYSPSRIATYVDQFPIPIAHLLRPLLHHPEAPVRYWGVMLLARHKTSPGLERDLSALTADPAPLVRRAAVASLTRLNVAEGVKAATVLLADPVWYVRAHAARAVGAAEDPEYAPLIAPLLADREWWVRTAAKDALQRMGSEVWSSLVPYLDHADAFARNGAAEVLQNVGILDSLIVLRRPPGGRVRRRSRCSAISPRPVEHTWPRRCWTGWMRTAGRACASRCRPSA